jgi:hypothetical protein
VSCLSSISATYSTFTADDAGGDWLSHAARPQDAAVAEIAGEFFNIACDAE